MKSKWIIPVFVLAVTVLPAGVAMIVQTVENRYTSLPVLNKLIKEDVQISFSDQCGKPVSTNEWKGKIVVAHCFFSHCTTVCPVMMATMKPVSAIPGVMIYSFTVDPGRDTVSRLNDYAAALELPPNWKLLTGNKPDLYRFLRKDLQLVATDGDGGENDFIHSENVVLIDTAGAIRGYYRGTDHAEIERLIPDIKKLIK